MFTTQLMEKVMGYLMASDDQYAEMRRLCRQLTNKYVSDEDAIKVVAQVHRNVGQQMKRKGKYFQKNPPNVYFRNYRGSGVSCGGKIGLSHTSSIYTIVHELAHEYHHQIHALVPKKNNKGIPDHHGPDYLAHLIFLKDMVLRLKVYGKWLDNPVEAIRTNPTTLKQKKVPLIERVGEEFKVKVLPSVWGALQYYTFDVGDEGDDFDWLKEKEMTRKKNFIMLNEKQLCDFTYESHNALGMLNPREYPEDRSSYNNLDNLTDAISDLRRKEQKIMY
jgi:hypothetical protein